MDELAAAFGRAGAAHAACHRCEDPACCEEPVLIRVSELLGIGQEIVQRELLQTIRRRLRVWLVDAAHILVELERLLRAGEPDEADEVYRRARVPCPLLVDGRCAVYASRPIACRAIWNLSDDPGICRSGSYRERTASRMEAAVALAALQGSTARPEGPLMPLGMALKAVLLADG